MNKDSLRAELREAWQELLGVAEAREDQNFFELGGDSLTALELVTRMEMRTGELVSIEALFEDGTFGAIESALLGDA